MMFLFLQLIFQFEFVVSVVPQLYGGDCLRADSQFSIVDPVVYKTGKISGLIYSMQISGLLDNASANWPLNTSSSVVPGTGTGVIEIKHPKLGRRLAHFIDSDSLAPYMLPNRFFHENIQDSLENIKLYNQSKLYSGGIYVIQGHSMLSYERKLKIYHRAIRNSMGIAFPYNNSIYLIDSHSDPSLIGQPISFILKLAPNSKKWVKVTTTGDSPLSVGGYSATCRGFQLYVTGGGGTNRNSIFVLDLTNFNWTRHIIPGFTGTENGCLFYDKGILFHSFGLLDGIGTNETQIINSQSWTKLDWVDMSSMSYEEEFHQGFIFPLLIEISIMGFIIILVTIFIAYKIFSHKQQQTKVLGKPIYHFEFLWCDPIISPCDDCIKSIYEYYDLFDSDMSPSINRLRHSLLHLKLPKSHLSRNLK